MVKRTLIATVLVAIGFAAGVVVGFRFVAKPYLWMGAVGESFMASQYAMTQYCEAEYPEAVEAMKAYIDYLERTDPVERLGWRPGEDPWLDERGKTLDATLAWIRLAVLHERNLNEEAAAEAWAQADLLAARGDWKDASHEHLREVVASLDMCMARGETGGVALEPPAAPEPE